MIIVQRSTSVKVNTMPDRAGQSESLDYQDPMVGRILDAAEQCISRFGIRRTSMGEISRVGKMSRGSIYNHFGDKESLVEGVFRRRQQLFLDRVEAMLEREKSLVDKLTLSVVQGRKEMRGGLFASLAETEPETVAMMFLDPRFYERSVAFCPPHIHIAQQAGEIRGDLNMDMATDFMMRLVVSLVMFPHMGMELKTRREIRDYLIQLVGQGLG